MPLIPESELHFIFSRSGGPGGQNVNKTATKAQVRWRLKESRAFSEEEKQRIHQALLGRLNEKDEIVVTADEGRSQFQNKEKAADRLQTLVRRALLPRQKRKLTKSTRASKLKRLETKRKRSEKKILRKELRKYDHWH